MPRPTRPRNFVAKYIRMAGRPDYQRDRKKAEKNGQMKHKHQTT